MSYDTYDTSVEIKREYIFLRVCIICKRQDICRFDEKTKTFKCGAHGGYVIKEKK